MWAPVHLIAEEPALQRPLVPTLAHVRHVQADVAPTTVWFGQTHRSSFLKGSHARLPF